jgi:hypothetical protein
MRHLLDSSSCVGHAQQRATSPAEAAARLAPARWLHRVVPLIDTHNHPPAMIDSRTNGVPS